MTLTFIQTSKLTYILNEVELSKEDFCLLLEANGYDVPRNLPHGEFFQRSLNSLSRLEESEFYPLFTEFITYTPQEKEYLRQLVTNRRLTTVYSSPG